MVIGMQVALPTGGGSIPFHPLRADTSISRLTDMALLAL